MSEDKPMSIQSEGKIFKVYYPSKELRKALREINVSPHKEEA